MQGAENGGDHRMPAAGNGIERTSHVRVVGERAFDRGAQLLHFVQVAASGEGYARAAHDHAAQRFVRIQRGEAVGQPPPHGGVQCIELAGVG